MQKRPLYAALTLALVLAACGGGSGTGEGDPDDSSEASTDDGVEVAGDDVSATVSIDGETWNLPNVACVVNVQSFDLIAAEGIIGVGSGPTVAVNVAGDPTDTEAGEAEIVFFEGALTSPDFLWRTTSDVGNAVVRIEGSRVIVSGLFDDGLTESTEEVEGTVEADCGEMPEVPVVTTTLPPNYEAHGFLTIGGENFDFTYDPEAGGRCGGSGNDGRVTADGFLVADPTAQVVFTYGLPAATPDSEADLQLIVYGSDGNQLWYSAVGLISGSDVGAIETLEQQGDTVVATGTLQKSGSDPEELADFSLQATCPPGS